MSTRAATQAVPAVKQPKFQQSAIDRVRAANIRLVADQRDGINSLARLLGYSNASFLSTMCGPHPTRHVSEKTARAFEKELDLPAGWLDTPQTPVATSVSQSPFVTVESEDLLQRTMHEIAAYAENAGVSLSNAKFADVVMLVYPDAVQHGAPRADMIRRAVQLAK